MLETTNGPESPYRTGVDSSAIFVGTTPYTSYATER